MIAPGSSLEAAGIQAERIRDLFTPVLYAATLIFVLVVGALVVAITRRPRPGDPPERSETPPEKLRGRRAAVWGATATTLLALVVLTVASVVTSRALASLGTKDAIPVDVIGHKWWWEMRYPAEVAGTQFATAYELHVPVGRAVEVRLQSTDVIHSFWVPSLHGKRDAIPGKRTSLVIRADQPGRYEGQCAEFCGLAHANMRFVVVAESPSDFRAWLEHNAAPATPPDDATKTRGQRVFMESRCIACHAIAGTEAFATVGPDLTHVASRRGIGMGTLPNDTGHLAGWIVDPQASKPGVSMPATPLPPDDLQALVAYLESLR